MKFHDFPGLDTEILKFQDFPGFPWPVRTLLRHTILLASTNKKLKRCYGNKIDLYTPE